MKTVLRILQFLLGCALVYYGIYVKDNISVTIGVFAILMWKLNQNQR